jgi:hypothetical protein
LEGCHGSSRAGGLQPRWLANPDHCRRLACVAGGAALRSGGEVAEEVIDKVARAGVALAAG